MQPSRLWLSACLFGLFLGCIGVGPTIARAEAAPPQFSLPLDCKINVDCFVQTYFDHDPGPGVRDHACGVLTRDKHTGIDIRVPNYVSMRKGVTVIAAAPGTVLKTRDGIEDIDVNKIGAEVVDKYGLGNTVLIDHGDGWVSIYGHMLKGSVKVKPGDRVEAGQPLGLVGLSGLTSYPHVHFMVQHDKKNVDPFTGVAGDTACGDTSRSLWAPATLAALAYRPTGFLTAGFATVKPDSEAARNGDYDAAELPASANLLAFWVDFYGQLKGDKRVISLIGPDGAVLARDEAIAEADKIYLLRFVGDRSQTGFPPGAYRGTLVLTRKIDGVPTELINIEKRIELR